MISKLLTKTVCLCACICAVCALLMGAVQLPSATNAFFVNDFANVIDTADEQEIYSAGVSLYNATKAQIVVVTVDSLSGMEVSDYALQLGEEWGVGDKDTDTGVVLLLSVTDRQVTIQVGYGLEGAINDAKAGRILDTYAIPFFKNDDFSQGLREAYFALISEAYNEFGLEENVNQQYLLPDELENKMSPYQIIVTIIGIIIVAILFVRHPHLFLLLFMRNNNRFRGGGGGFEGGHGGFRGGGGSFGGGGASRGGF